MWYYVLSIGTAIGDLYFCISLFQFSDESLSTNTTKFCSREKLLHYFIHLDAFRNEDITKGVLICGTQVEHRSVHALNETTFLVTYSSGILAEEIGSAIENIEEWLGKPVVITCDDVTAIQLPNSH